MCSNCGKNNSFKLNKTGKRAVMSDGSFASDFVASQDLCQNCGAIFISYEPANRLAKYFSEEYDISDEVQDCQVVISGTRQGKHSVIHNSLLDACKDLPSNGNFLEIACGNGALSRKFATLHSNWKCSAIDPSIKSGQNITDKVLFIHDFFNPKLFKDQKFDVIVAHGILNRTEPLKMLGDIASIANNNALISIEVVTIENSIFVPFIWDHCYTFLEEVFVLYMISLGIVVEKRVDCGSTVQFLCRLDREMKTGFQYISPDLIESSLALYKNHLSTWDGIKNNFFEAIKKSSGKKIALFGAGLYNGVLASLLPCNSFDLIIDEFRAGGLFDKMRIISLDDAINTSEEMIIYLCCRPSHLDYLKEKLVNKGFLVQSLL